MSALCQCVDIKICGTQFLLLVLVSAEPCIASVVPVFSDCTVQTVQWNEVGNGVHCEKDSLIFDFVTCWNGQCTCIVLTCHDPSH